MDGLHIEDFAGVLTKGVLVLDRHRFDNAPVELPPFNARDPRQLLATFARVVDIKVLLAPIQLLQTPQRLPSGEETGYGLGWDLETVTLAGEQTRAVGHDGDALGGIVTSLMTFPERGLVVAVSSNISYAETPALALEIAEAFAERTDSRTRK